MQFIRIEGPMKYTPIQCPYMSAVTGPSIRTNKIYPRFYYIKTNKKRQYERPTWTQGVQVGLDALRPSFPELLTRKHKTPLARGFMQTFIGFSGEPEKHSYTYCITNSQTKVKRLHLEFKKLTQNLTDDILIG